MRLPHLKFVWAPDHQEASWSLGLVGSYQRESGGADLLAVSVRGACLWGLGLLLAAYFAGAAALAFWLDRKPYNFITYFDLVVPTRWPMLKSLRGEALIRQGLDDFHNKKWDDALKELQTGLGRDPNTTKGRLELAALILGHNDRRHAEEILRAGITPVYPGKPYLFEVCRFAGQGENYDLWLYTCDTALAEVAAQPQFAADRPWLIRQKLSALVAAGRNEDAVRLADAEGENQSDVMREFKVLALLKDGKATDAVAFLSDWRARATAPEEIEQVRRLQVRTYRESGQLGEMERCLAELRNSDPASPAPYAYAIVQHLMAGQRTLAETALQDFLVRFSGQAANLNLLAEPLAEVAEEPMLGRLLDEAQSEGFSLLAIQRTLVLAEMKNGHWSSAAALLAVMKPKLPRNDPVALLWMDLMTRTVDAALDPSDPAQEKLVSFLASHHLQLRLYRDAVDGLRQADRVATARTVVGIALRVYPDNAPLKEAAASLDAVVAQLPKAPAAAPSAAAGILAEGETKFIAALGASLAAHDDQAAIAQIHAVRSAHPTWLAAHDEELRHDEILLAARQHDTTALLTASNLFLDGSESRSLAALNLAQELHLGETLPESLLLLQAILQRNPGFPPASRLLATWAPANAPGTSTLPRPGGVAPLAPLVSGEDATIKALAETMQSGDYKQALARIVAIRAARPAWLANRDQELRGDEIVLDGRMHDEGAMLAVIRVFLNGTTARSLAALELAKQLHGGDTVPESLQVVQEILRKSPGFPPATRQLAGWQSPASGQ